MSGIAAIAMSNSIKISYNYSQSENVFFLIFKTLMMAILEYRSIKFLVNIL